MKDLIDTIKEEQTQLNEAAFENWVGLLQELLHKTANTPAHGKLSQAYEDWANKYFGGYKKFRNLSKLTAGIADAFEEGLDTRIGD